MRPYKMRQMDEKVQKATIQIAGPTGSRAAA